jgi:hypothetical protein
MGVIRRVVSFTPVLANAGSYSANDQLGAVNTLDNSCADPGGTVEIESLVVLDSAKQSLALDVLFFDVLPVLASADNAEFEMTDALFNAGFKGVIKVVAGDYIAQKNGSAANPKNQGLFIRAVDASKKLYCVVVTRGAPTYALGDLIFRVGIKQGAS